MQNLTFNTNSLVTTDNDGSALENGTFVQNIPGFIFEGDVTISSNIFVGISLRINSS